MGMCHCDCEAKPKQEAIPLRLLRRCAPRNDELDELQ